MIVCAGRPSFPSRTMWPRWASSTQTLPSGPISISDGAPNAAGRLSTSRPSPMTSCTRREVEFARKTVPSGRTATARGFGDDIKLPVLAKLMLAERFIPRLFEQIAFVAAVHPQGLCEDLGTLEQGLAAADGNESQAGAGKRQTAAESAPALDSAVLTEWKSSDTVCNWARLSPKLAGIDLRPYLFVTKDKKDYFGPVSVLGHLAGVVEKLFGGRMTVQSHEAELKQLVQPEAEKVFEAVRTKIMSTGTFDTKPAGVDGLVVLVKAQPGLQSRLMDFLEALPSSKCGPWAVSGWQGVIKDTDCSSRLTKLLGDWSKVTNNAALKATAEAALKDLKGGR